MTVVRASLVSAAVLLAGCDHPGYQGPAVRTGFDSETLFARVERIVSAARTDVRAMHLVDECTMRIEWTDGVVRTYDLLRFRTAIPREDDGERYALLVKNPQAGTQRMLLGTSHWGQYMMVRSSIGHLRGLCASSRNGPDPATG